MIFKRLKKPDPEVEQKLRDDIDAYGGLEKNDVLAMIISAMLMILPIVVIALQIRSKAGNSSYRSCGC